MTLTSGYKTSVNEPETITDAKAIDGAIGSSNRDRWVSEPFWRLICLAAAVARSIERS
jgi:hypothetical protein